MPNINPYLNFNGNAEEAFNVYKSIFGGEFTAVMRFRDMPQDGSVKEADMDKIMHISLPVGSNVLMASDVLESMGQQFRPGNNNYVSLGTDSKEDADRVFAVLSEGGTVEMPMQDAFWGDYFGSLIDRFGIGWMISYAPQP